MYWPQGKYVRSLARADADTRKIGAAATRAVGIGNTATRDELSAVTLSDVLSTSQVNRQLGGADGRNYNMSKPNRDNTWHDHRG